MIKNQDDCFGPNGCFKALIDNDKEFFTNKKQQLNYSKGENLFKQGAFAPYVMFLYEGLVKVYLEIGNGKQISIRIASAGEFISFQSVLGQAVYQYSALALTDCRICLMDKEGLQKLLKQEYQSTWNLIAQNYMIESDLYSVLQNATGRQMPGKLAYALLYLSDEKFKAYKLFQNLSRKDIAEFAGISLESAVKLLKEFETDELIALKGKDIEIVNRAGLEKIRNNG